MWVHACTCTHTRTHALSSGWKQSPRVITRWGLSNCQGFQYTPPPTLTILLPVHFLLLSFLHYSFSLMISLGGSSPRGTVRGTLFCWPLISGFEAGGGATAGESLRNGLSVGGWGAPGVVKRAHHLDTPATSKTKTVALKQNSKSACWGFPAVTAGDTHAHHVWNGSFILSYQTFPKCAPKISTI